MLRTVALLSVFGLLALVFGMALNSGGGVGFSLLPGSVAFEPMLSARTGAPVTLEVVQKDVLWHRHTLHVLRELVEVSGRTPKPRADCSSSIGRSAAGCCGGFRGVLVCAPGHRPGQRPGHRKGSPQPLRRPLTTRCT